MPYLARWEARQPAKPSAAECLNFIFVGNQARRKGLDLFIRFAAELRKRETRRKLKFVVVSNFQDGADFDLTGLEIHQGLGGEAVQDLMEKSHYLVLPTRRDSHPKVCYEAAATGCGLIISDIRPMADIWGANSYVFPLAQGADAMGPLAADVMAGRLDPVGMGQKNRKLFLDEFCPSASMRIHREAVFGSNP
jgi:glycosyltransferase involved in cell wall biosynthesis